MSLKILSLKGESMGGEDLPLQVALLTHSKAPHPPGHLGKSSSLINDNCVVTWDPSEYRTSFLRPKDGQHAAFFYLSLLALSLKC